MRRYGLLLAGLTLIGLAMSGCGARPAAVDYYHGPFVEGPPSLATWVPYCSTLADLASNAEVIARVRIVESHPYLHHGLVETDHVAAVERTYFGSPADTITIFQAGGQVDSVVTDYPDFPVLRPGQTCILFLRKRVDDPGRYLILGPRAVAEFVDGRLRVTPLDDNVTRTLHGITEDTFVHQLDSLLPPSPPAQVPGAGPAQPLAPGPLLVSRAEPNGRPISEYYRLPFKDRAEAGVGLVYSPDGRLAAYGNGDFSSFFQVIYDDVCIVDLTAGKEQKAFSFDMLGPGAVPTRDMYAMDLIWANDGSALYLALMDERRYFYSYEPASAQLAKVTLDPCTTAYRHIVASLPGAGEKDILVWERPESGSALVLYGRDGSRGEELVLSSNDQGLAQYCGFSRPYVLYTVGGGALPEIKALNLDTREVETVGVGFGACFRPGRQAIAFTRPIGYTAGEPLPGTPGFEVVECPLGEWTPTVIATFPSAELPRETQWNATGDALYLLGTLDSKIVFP